MTGGAARPRRARAYGWVGPWLGRGALVVGTTVLLLGLLALVVRSTALFWPAPVAEWVIETDSGDSRRVFAQRLGHDRRSRGGSGGVRQSSRYLLRMAGADGPEHRWIDARRVLRHSRPKHLVTVTTAGGRQLHGYVRGIETAAAGSGVDMASTPVALSALLVLTLADHSERRIPLLDIAALEYPNQRSLLQRVRRAGTSILEFIAGDETNAGLVPVLYGTSLMALLMVGMLIPPALLCALYLHRYGRGTTALALRLAVTSLAAVPPVVVGVFVLGCLVYTIGPRLDSWLFGTPSPVLATGGLVWAALALAVVSLPVMIATTESGLRAVPEHERRGALALGASPDQVMRSLVLPRAVPFIAGGALLAVARAAGAVAPLLVVGGAVDLAAAAETVGREGVPGDESFGHLGRRLYVLAVLGRDTYTVAAHACATALLLLTLVLSLNWAAARCLRGLPGQTPT